MPLHEENQIIAFKKIRTLTPIKQVEEVERLATKEPSKLNFALNVYLAQLYKYTSDGTYSENEKKLMRSFTDELVSQLVLNSNAYLKAEALDTFSLNAAKNAAAAVIGEARVVNQPVL